MKNFSPGQDAVCSLRVGRFHVQLHERAIVFFLLALFMLLNLGSIRNKTLTTDEPKHYQYGRNILNLNSDRFDDSKMPFSALNALPAKLAELVTLEPLNTFLQKPQTGRIVTMAFSIGVAFFVYRWSRSLYGVLPGLLSLFLYVFDPNIIAHSRLVTTDVYALGMIFLTLYTFWLFSRDPSWKFATLSAVTLGFSQLAKYTCAYLYPILAILVIIRGLPALVKNLGDKAYPAIGRKIAIALGWSLFFLVISLLIINIGFLFNDTLMPLGEYTFRSELFQGIQERLSLLGSLPVPFPYPYIEGLDWVKARERSGGGYGRVYLLGETREVGGFNGYYIVASILKVPLAAQVLILLAFVFFLKNWDKTEFFDQDIFLLVPVIFFFFYFNFFYRAQIGIRFYLVLFPFLYVFAGRLLQDWRARQVSYKVVLAVLIVAQVVSVGVHFPHYIPYFNALVWDQRDAYNYLADSNLDWEQAEWYLDRFMEAHPEAKFEPSRPTLGTIVVSPNKLVGVEGPPDGFLWLREHFRPRKTIADVYLVYEITEDAYNAVRDQIETEQ